MHRRLQLLQYVRVADIGCCGVELTCVHGTQHACDEFVDAVTFLHQRDQGGYSALVVSTTPEMREDQFLELLDPILKSHEVGDSLVPFVGVVDPFQANVFLVFEGAIEIWMLGVEGQFGKQKIHVFLDQRSISTKTFTCHPSVQTVNPAPICHCFS